MSEVVNGWRSILKFSWIYDFFQALMGADKGYKAISEDFIRAKQGDKVLDLGCGTAKILEFMPKINYIGFDINQKYISYAKNKYGSNGIFHCGYAEVANLKNYPPFDIVIIIGVLHHLNDESVHGIYRLASEALRKGGRLITIDAVYIPNQNKIARFLISLDRGRNVRTMEGYQQLTNAHFKNNQLTVRHQTFIPYTHIVIESEKT